MLKIYGSDLFGACKSPGNQTSRSHMWQIMYHSHPHNNNSVACNIVLVPFHPLVYNISVHSFVNTFLVKSSKIVIYLNILQYLGVIQVQKIRIVISVCHNMNEPF